MIHLIRTWAMLVLLRVSAMLTVKLRSLKM